MGFGAGDLIAKDLMETYNNLPPKNPSADIAICILGNQNTQFALEVARKLRANNKRVFVDLSNKKIGDQISNANKRNIQNVICIGDEETSSQKLKIKDLVTGNETELTPL